MQTNKFSLNKKFAAVVLNDGKVIDKLNQITLQRLILLAKKLKPKYISIDNIFEIAPSDKISRFLIKLPSDTELVQVTGAPNAGFVSLKQLIKDILGYKINLLTPIDSAYYSALLAYHQVGFVVKCINPYTIILVSRSRHPGKGGQSQARYQRRLQVEVKEATTKIKNILKENNIPFDIFFIKTAYGYKKSKIVAYTTYDDISKLLKSDEIYSKIKILPSIGALEYMAIGKTNIPKKVAKPIIVGIDPGITVGLACIDLQGNILLLKSKKEWTQTEIIRDIVNIGNPVLICSDITPVSAFVQKIASILNSKIFVPKKSLTVFEKRTIIDENISTKVVKNTHERDALSAALKAFTLYKRKIEKLYKRMKEENLVAFSDVGYTMLFKGLSIAAIINSLKNSIDRKLIDRKTQKSNFVKKEKSLISQASQALQEKLLESNKTIEMLEWENKKLKNEIIELKRLVENLELKLTKIHTEEFRKILLNKEIIKRDTIIEKLSEKIKLLERKIQHLEKEVNINALINRYRKDPKYLVVKILDNFSLNEIEFIDKKYGILENDVLYFKTGGGGPSTVQYLYKKKIKAIIIETEIAHNIVKEFEKLLIPIIRCNELPNINIIGPYAIIDAKTFKEVFINKRKLLQRKARQDMELKIERILDEYRSKRWLR